MTIPQNPPLDMATALAHLERLADLHMGQVIAEGITEPGAVLARMVELDNELIARQLKSLAAQTDHLAHRAHTEPSYEAKRGAGIVRYMATRFGELAK